MPVLLALIRFLGQLDDGAERYKLLVESPQGLDWLRPHCGPSQEIVARFPVPDGNGLRHERHQPWLKATVKRALRPALPAIRAIRGRLTPGRNAPQVAVSDGYYESLGCDVIHFPTQGFTQCALPTIYNPHDLQHRHYPSFFPPEELAFREAVYGGGCRLAHTVVVGSRWIKDDVIRQYQVPPERVQIIPWAAPTLAYRDVSDEQMRQVARKFDLREPFALYPAVTWPHKNHLRLLEALARLRDARGCVVPLVCTGARYPSHWPTVERRVAQLGLTEQVKFLGFVTDAELRSLYRLAQFLVLPTLFEADSCPVHEAWLEGLPVASSNVTAMPDQVLDAGLLFDPMHVESIADAIQRMATDAALRSDLRERGFRRAQDFDWDRTARAFRAVYRRAAGVTLGEEDRWLLDWDWMAQPRREVELVK